MGSRLDPRSLIGVRVKVHFNLHTHTWSITAMSGEHAGRVVANADTVTLTDVTFKVSSKGRERCHRLGKRTVHAWVVGVVLSVNEPADTSRLVKVTYSPNPTRPASFTTVDGRPIGAAPRATFARCLSRPDRGYAWI